MRPDPKPLIALLVKRAVLFMFGSCALSLFLYAVGTAQEFLESTQLLLLRLSYLSALLLAIGAVYGLLLDLFFAYRLRRRTFLWGVLAYAGLASFAVLVVLLSGGILVAVVGNLV
jgi:hypothetical protein